MRIWDPATARQAADPLSGHTGPVRAVTAFTGPDGRTLLATGSSDDTVRIWDPATGSESLRLAVGAPVHGIVAGTYPDGTGQFLAIVGRPEIGLLDISESTYSR